MYEFLNYLNIFFDVILSWLPWLYIYVDTFFLQLIIVYLIYLLVTTNSTFNVLLYIFLEIVYLGLVVGLYQLEFFTGFLWAAEFTVVFVILLLLFYLNVEGHWAAVNLSKYRVSFFFLFLIFFIFNFFYFFSEVECYLPFSLNINDYWDDYYESLSNSNMNDFVSLLISYYAVNSLSFICVGFIFLIGSVVCVNMVRYVRNNKNKNIGSFLSVFNFFKNFVNYIFSRKQNLNKQMSAVASVRIIKKKKEW